MTTQTTIKSELKRRMDLVNDVSFRKSCAEMAKDFGITPEEWNKNKSGFILMMANEICGIENRS